MISSFLTFLIHISLSKIWKNISEVQIDDYCIIQEHGKWARTIFGFSLYAMSLLAIVIIQLGIGLTLGLGLGIELTLGLGLGQVNIVVVIISLQ